MSDPITSVVVSLFSGAGVALALAGAILLASLVIIAYSELLEQRPLAEGLNDQIHSVAFVGPQDFKSRLDELDRKLGGALVPTVLARGWRTYRRYLIRIPGERLVSAATADAIIPHFDEPARTLEWWANITVGVGLLITFLGIVAALAESTSAIAAGAGKSSSAVEGALLGLLAIAATKFWTSIAGVFSSIILRIVARRRRIRLDALRAAFCETLDDATHYVPPELALVDAFIRQTGEGRP